MVSSSVEVITRSYKGGDAVKWVCNEDGTYEMCVCPEDESPLRGTSIIMHLNSEGDEYLSIDKLSDILKRYCAFMPVDIYLLNDNNSDNSSLLINDKEPLWLKNPSDCLDEEYKDFYKKVFRDYKDPLFWVHIKADYPLNYKGILFFPKITNEYESHDGEIKLYYNQVFVADNIKGVVPDYFFMIKGVLDCPELPLNVSRSYLQNSSYVSKISSHIVKKIADRLNYLFNTDRNNYAEQWKDIKTFVEYACLNDKKFYDRIKNSILYERCDDNPITLQEYLDLAKEKHENKVYYTSDVNSQAGYLSMFKKEGIDVVLLQNIIDAQFIQLIENTEDKIKFCRVDSELPASMKNDVNDVSEDLISIFKEILPEKTVIKLESFKDSSIPAVLNVNEDSRRIEDMMKMYSSIGQEFAKINESTEELILNANCPIISNLSDNPKKEIIAKQIYKLCLISRRQLSPDELNEFLSDSYNVLSEL